jgi:hypothetical protein
MHYFSNLLCAFSQFINALAGGNHNEMLSARAYRKDIKWLIRVINFLFLDSNHCKKAFEYERDNPQLPFTQYLNNFY